MLTAVIGIVTALIFGSADFLGGLASKRISPLRATAIAAVVGLIGLLVALPFVGGAWSGSAVLWGGLSGVSGALAISLLYACLAIGPMSILSPLTAVVSAIVPMTWGLLGGDQLSPLGYVALGLALVAVVLVGFVPDATAVRPSARGLAMAVASGAMIGVFMILIDATPSDSGLVPLIMNRAVNAAIMIATIGVIAWWSARRRASRPGAPAREVPVETAGHHLAGGSTLPHGMPEDERVTDAPATGGWRPGLPFAIACGVIDALANALLLVGMRLGDLSVISVLTALYPAGTIILAAIVLRERIAIVQWVGLVLAIGAAGMLALG